MKFLKWIPINVVIIENEKSYDLFVNSKPKKVQRCLAMSRIDVAWSKVSGMNKEAQLLTLAWMNTSGCLARTNCLFLRGVLVKASVSGKTIWLHTHVELSQSRSICWARLEQQQTAYINATDDRQNGAIRQIRRLLRDFVWLCGVCVQSKRKMF